MRYLCFLILFIGACTPSKKVNSDYINFIENDRKQKISSFRTIGESPLDEEELKTFKGLSFFDADESYKVKAVLNKTPDLPFFDMPHSNNKTRSYVKYGDITFELKGKQYKLPVYTNESFLKENELFFPFTDLTNGKQTYAGGRYLDLKFSDSTNEIMLDFNLCYHPYCAFSHRYSCPIVPKENHMDTEVTAGEKFQ